MSHTTWNDPARDVLASTRYRGIRWRVEGGRVFLSGNVAALTEADRSAIDQVRPALVAILENLPARCAVPHMCCVIGPCERCPPADGSATNGRSQETP